MKDYGIVHGSEAQAKELIVNVDTVYVHDNITKIDDNDYTYHEVQYGKDEYIQLMAEQNKELNEILTIILGGNEYE